MRLTIEKVVVGGQGLARVPAEVEQLGGMRVFVPFTLAGEIVEAEIRGKYKGYCTAEVGSIEHASKFRTTAPCPWFGACGGCQLQHSEYENQVQIKCGILAETLTRAGLRELPPISTLTAQPFAYRNRIRLQVQSKPTFAIGYRKAKSHDIVAIDHCPVAAPLLQRSIAVIDALGQQGALHDELLEVELFTNHNQSELLATCWSRPRRPFPAEPWLRFLERLQNGIPQLSGAAIHAEEANSSHPAGPVLQWGKKSLRYQAAGRDYTVSPGSFFQVNSTLLNAFIAAATEGDQGNLAWDLYAGVGLFSLPLSQNFARVVAVESSAAAGRDFRVNLRNAGAKLVTAAVLDFLRAAAGRREADPDLVLLDPPRAGLGVEASGLLGRCSPRRIVYVSCDPATLGRDLAALIQSGYHLQRLQLVDMFPQTHHLETIAVLQR